MLNVCNVVRSDVKYPPDTKHHAVTRKSLINCSFIYIIYCIRTAVLSRIGTICEIYIQEAEANHLPNLSAVTFCSWLQFVEEVGGVTMGKEPLGSLCIVLEQWSWDKDAAVCGWIRLWITQPLWKSSLQPIPFPFVACHYLAERDNEPTTENWDMFLCCPEPIKL